MIYPGIVCKTLIIQKEIYNRLNILIRKLKLITLIKFEFF